MQEANVNGFPGGEKGMADPDKRSVKKREEQGEERRIRLAHGHH